MSNMTSQDDQERSYRSEAHIISLQNTLVLFAILLTVGFALSSTDALPVSIITGLVTAIVTVVLTFWFYRVRDTVRSLQALQSELQDNRERSLKIRDFVLADLAALEQGGQSGNIPHEFSTAAYETAAKNGVLLEITDETRSLLETHYREIDLANRHIDQRLMNRQGASLALSTSSEISKQTDAQILSKIMSLTDDRIVVGEDDMALEIERKSSDDSQTRDEVQFDNVIEQVETELDRFKPITKIVG